MKTLTLILTLTFGATSASAFVVNTVTPPLTFPEDTTSGDTVSRDKMSVGN